MPNSNFDMNPVSLSSGVVPGNCDGRKQVPPGADSSPISRLEQIRALIEDPNLSVARLSRMIAAEMASALLFMERVVTGPEFFDKRVQIRNICKYLHGLRELSNQLFQLEKLFKDNDIDFDGPKFAFVSGVWVDVVLESLREIGLDDHTIRNFVLHYADKIAEREPQLRRDTKKIGSK